MSTITFVTLFDKDGLPYKVKIKQDGSTVNTEFTVMEGIKAALTDGSSSITAGGTRQQVFAANLDRVYLYLANPLDGTETLYVNIDANASGTARNSYELNPGDQLPFDGAFIPSGAVDIVGATTGSKFIAKQATPP